MDDLFRFLLLRPAEPAKTSDLKVLSPSFIVGGSQPELKKRRAQEFVKNKSFILNPDELAYASAARAVSALLRAGPATAAAISGELKAANGNTAKGAVADKRFAAEEVRIADTLVAMKVLSNSSGADAPALLQLAQGYQAIRLAASGRDPVSIPVLYIDDAVLPRAAATHRAARAGPARANID